MRDPSYGAYKSLQLLLQLNILSGQNSCVRVCLSVDQTDFIRNLFALGLILSLVFPAPTHDSEDSSL